MGREIHYQIIHQTNMKSFNLQYYVNKLKNSEKFSLARYGDGEMLCMWGRKGANSNGCRYSPELRQGLLESMHHKDSTFIYGMQRVLPMDMARMLNEYPDIDWHDSEIWGEAVANGELYPFIEQLKKMRVVIISNKTIKPVAEMLGAEFIEVPPSNAFDNPPIFEVKKDYVYLFACGMAANVFVSRLHGQDAWFIDVGHIFDPLVGIMSRCDLEGKTLEDMKKNYE